ncbi:hypothetical protein TTHERM_00316340 (macronuclear) [Tetrahymena thermophila SB210]|uniref:Uncharacterized protein n=1 Tax=Tetrahymena thermophila (strain SB210) TaxID=312017 RepID=I7ML32_TETTS|nr:hypothetical protein TTHERM_00316340 [Tetrahymena thermophila SB210]EAS01081.1 hypothetical protein TTHERM_00316340 [Tetrahymena thermophila SB210]|eukprot:XP_001021326.1 hypothetical protein TTHERM_00316340 [Tetrahymena thermophila SB210]
MKNKRKANPSLSTNYQEEPSLQVFQNAILSEQLGTLQPSTTCQRCSSPFNLSHLNHSYEQQKQNQFFLNASYENQQSNQNEYQDINQKRHLFDKETEINHTKNNLKKQSNDVRRSLQVQSTKNRSNTYNRDNNKKQIATSINNNSFNNSKKMNFSSNEHGRQDKNRKSSPLKLEKDSQITIQLKTIDNIVEQKVKKREQRLIEKENAILELQENFKKKIEELDNKLNLQLVNQQQDRSVNDFVGGRLQQGQSIPIASAYIANNLNGQNVITSSSSIDGRITSQTGQNESIFNIANRNNTFARNSSDATTNFTNNQSTSLFSQNGISSDQLLIKQSQQNQQRLNIKSRDLSSEENLHRRNRSKTSNQFTEDLNPKNIYSTNNNSYANCDFLNYTTVNGNNFTQENTCNYENEDFNNQQNSENSDQSDQPLINQAVNCQCNITQTNINQKIQNRNLVLENLSYSISNKNSNSTKTKSISPYGQVQTPNNAGQFNYRINTQNSYQNSGKTANDILNNTLSLNNTNCMLNQTQYNNHNMLNQTLNNNQNILNTTLSNNLNLLNTTNLAINEQFLDQKIMEKQKQLEFIEHEMFLKEKAIKEKKEQIIDLDRNISEKKEYIRKYTDNFEILRENAHQIKIDLNEEEKILEKVKEEKKKELEETKNLKKELSNLNEKIAVSKAELEQVEAHMKEKEVQLKEKSDKLQLVQLQLQQTESQIETQMIMIRQQTDQIEIRFKQLNDLSVFVDKERRKLQQKEADVENLNQNCIAIREQNSNKEKQLKKREEDVYRMQLHLDVERTGIEELKQKLKEQEAVISSEKKKLDEVASQLSQKQQNLLEYKEGWEKKLKEKEENLFQREGSIKMKEELLIQQSQLYQDLELKMEGLNLQGQLWEKKCMVDQQNIIQLQKKYSAQGLFNSASAQRKKKIVNSQSGDFSNNKENDLFIKTNIKSNLFPPSSLKLVPQSTTNETTQSSQKPPYYFSNAKSDYMKQTNRKQDDNQMQNYTQENEQYYRNEQEFNDTENDQNLNNANIINQSGNTGLIKINTNEKGQNKNSQFFKNFNKK